MFVLKPAYNSMILKKYTFFFNKLDPVAVITSDLDEIFKIGMRYQRIWIKSALRIYVMETEHAKAKE